MTYVAVLCYRSDRLHVQTQEITGTASKVFEQYRNLVRDMRGWGTPLVWSHLLDQKTGDVIDPEV